jgi:ABC-type dipeptide/oligopeptide/nickel transport system permease component
VYSMVVSRVDRLTEVKVASRNVLDLLFDFLLSTFYILLASVLYTASISTLLGTLGVIRIQNDFRISDLPLGDSGNSKR